MLSFYRCWTLVLRHAIRIREWCREDDRRTKGRCVEDNGRWSFKLYRVVHRTFDYSVPDSHIRFRDNSDSIPQIGPYSRLHLYPVLKMVCVFPIDECCGCEEQDYEDKDMPIYYTIVDDARMRELEDRVRTRKKYSRKKREGLRYRIRICQSDYFVSVAG